MAHGTWAGQSVSFVTIPRVQCRAWGSAALRGRGGSRLLTGSGPMLGLIPGVKVKIGVDVKTTARADVRVRVVVRVKVTKIWKVFRGLCQG